MGCKVDETAAGMNDSSALGFSAAEGLQPFLGKRTCEWTWYPPIQPATMKPRGGKILADIEIIPVGDSAVFRRREWEGDEVSFDPECISSLDVAVELRVETSDAGIVHSFHPTISLTEQGGGAKLDIRGEELPDYDFQFNRSWASTSSTLYLKLEGEGAYSGSIWEVGLSEPSRTGPGHDEGAVMYPAQWTCAAATSP